MQIEVTKKNFISVVERALAKAEVDVESAMKNYKVLIPKTFRLLARVMTKYPGFLLPVTKYRQSAFDFSILPRKLAKKVKTALEAVTFNIPIDNRGALKEKIEAIGLLDDDCAITIDRHEFDGLAKAFQVDDVTSTYINNKLPSSMNFD